MIEGSLKYSGGTLLLWNSETWINIPSFFLQSLLPSILGSAQRDFLIISDMLPKGENILLEMHTTFATYHHTWDWIAILVGKEKAEEALWVHSQTNCSFSEGQWEESWMRRSESHRMWNTEWIISPEFWSKCGKWRHVPVSVVIMAKDDKTVVRAVKW